ncbi:uncharacterized protein LOC121738870 [Aricia agestis]|uniref:uncharacterized protein LOC121738870 n=1 Tax=Aricia agestis TaxID=91739 RepID=UPI001C201858|nr:uncharacterized protein LOC121738870 [Aricia agestis]
MGKIDLTSGKPFEEISAVFNGNEIKIRVPKSTFKTPILTPSQEKIRNMCTCEDNDSACSETCGQPGKSDQGNKLHFQIPDDICEALTNRTPYNSEVVYSKKEHHDNLCDVTPKDAPKGVEAHKVLRPDKDIFLLKIGKQTGEPNRTGNIEVELITPKAPAKPKPALHSCKQIQCEDHSVCCPIPRGGCKKDCVPRKKRPKVNQRGKIFPC